jgi:hypothetical protein
MPGEYTPVSNACKIVLGTRSYVTIYDAVDAAKHKSNGAAIVLVVF